MTKEEMVIYAQKYKKTQKKLCIGFGIFIVLIALALFVAATIIMIYANDRGILYGVGAVMIIAGIVDLFFTVKFVKTTLKRLKNIKDIEAAKRYCKIYGFNSKIEE